MKDLSIDIETRSSVDITKCGAYKYALSDDFEILLFGFKADGLPAVTIDLACGETLPDDIKHALSDPGVTKHAWNAAFEWWCLNQAGYLTPIDQWVCTMTQAVYMGYPSALEKAGDALGIEEDKKKLATGKALIRYFSKACKPTKSNGNRTWNLPHHDPYKWELYKEYNTQDVEAEYAIGQKLDYGMPEKEIERWRRDTLMNARGVKIDRALVDGALTISDRANEDLLTKAKKITGLDNPKSNVQTLAWVRSRGVDTNDLQKGTVAALIDSDIPDDVREALLLRQQINKSSIAKYEAMARVMGPDDKARGLIQYYGANRTGRYAGRLIQVQNLPRNYLKTLDTARDCVIREDMTGLRVLYADIPDTLSQLIRTAFVPGKDKFIVCDFSSIEARIAAWLSGEEWVLDVFRNGGDIYCATASQMFGVPVEKNGVNKELRQKGKIATLALGYQGGVGALRAMGALEMGIKEEELQGIVNAWRNANSRIRDMWYTVEQSVRDTIETGQPHHIAKGVSCALVIGDNRISYLVILLPSGREMFYAAPRIDYSLNEYGSIVFEGSNQTTKKWEAQETYGGKLFENIVQAIARDCLVETLFRVEDAGFTPVMHVHDEIIMDAEEGQTLEDVKELFALPIAWAEGLPLSGDGFEARYYQKG